MDNFDWTPITQALQSFVLAVLPVLAAFVARWLNAKYQNERSQLDETKLYWLDNFIRVSIYAAEQLKLTEAIDSKLDYVTVLVENWLFDHGLEMDMDEVRARIEAAVKQEFPHAPQPES